MLTYPSLSVYTIVVIPVASLKQQFYPVLIR